MLEGNGLCIRCLGGVIRTKTGSLHVGLGEECWIVSIPGLMLPGVGGHFQLQRFSSGGSKEATFYFPIAKTESLKTCRLGAKAFS